METTGLSRIAALPSWLTAVLRHRTLVVALPLAIFALPGAGPATLDNDAPSVPPLFGGIQINEHDHDRWVASVRDAGLDSVQVTVYARQGRWDSPELSWEPDWAAVAAELGAARRARLRTVLVLRVALEHGLEANRHLWHGMIWPTDGAVDAWFAGYREFALQGAELAAREGVDLLAIGNELSAITSTVPVTAAPDLYAYFASPTRVAAVHAVLAQCAQSVQQRGQGSDLQHLDGGRYPTLSDMLAGEAAVRYAWARRVLGQGDAGLAAFNARRQRHEAAWREIIAAVRARYRGALTYGANFDQFAEVGFWDALDAVGVNAYFPLGLYGIEERSDRRRRLRDAWEGVAAALERAAPGRPVLFLELGWTRRRGATVRPYSYDRVEVLETAPDGADLTCVHWATQPLDPDERVDAMRALAGTVEAGRFPSLRGLQLWKLTTRAEHRAIEPFAVGLGRAADTADAEFLAATVRIAANVRSLRPATPGAPSAAMRHQDDEQLQLGEEIFLSECASCHGNQGKGDGPAARFYDPPPRDLTTGSWQFARDGTAAEIARVVASGVDDTAMEPFEEVLSEEEIAAVARWVAERVARPEAGAGSDGGHADGPALALSGTG